MAKHAGYPQAGKACAVKVLIYSGYSDNNRDVAELSRPNWSDYARRHGYEVKADNVPWDEWKLEGLKRTREHLKNYHLVACIGSDVLFMNQTIELPPLCHDNEMGDLSALTISREAIGWWPINNDVALWYQCEAAFELLDRLIADAPIWLKYPWLWQNHLWNLMQQHLGINMMVNVRECRELQSTHRDGASKWQLGDFIIHLLDCDNETKKKLIKMYLPFAGDGTY